MKAPARSPRRHLTALVVTLAALLAVSLAGPADAHPRPAAPDGASGATSVAAGAVVDDGAPSDDAEGPPATPAGDQCRQAGGPDRVCRSLDAAANAATQLCRSGARLPAQECATPSGQEVDPSLVDAYHETWQHRAHGLQRALGDRLPFAQAQVLATHNADNAAAYRPTVSNLDANQQYAIYDQLRMDVRRLELDIHWFPHAPSGGYAPVLCHGTGEHVGCSVDRHLAEGLEEIARFLDEHPDEIVVVRFEANLDGDREAYDTAAAVVDEHLGPYAYKREGDGCEGLPLDMTFEEVRDAGRQVVLVSDCGVGDAWPDLVYGYDTRRETKPVDFAGYPDCGPDFTRDDYDSLLIRYYEDRTWLSTMAGAADDPITAHTAREMMRCGVNQVTFDHLTPDDPRLTSTLWSWAPDEPSRGDACAEHGPDGRFRAVDCGERRHFVCSTVDGGWEVTARTGPWALGGLMCRAELGSEATFDVPGAGFANEQVREASGGRAAWLAYAADDGPWRITTPTDGRG
jgi:hypothetical protein